MKKFIIGTSIASILAAGIFCWPQTRSSLADEAPRQTAAAKVASGAEKLDQEDLSYALGMTIGHQLQAQKLPLDTAAFTEGLQAILNNTKPRLSDEQAQDVLVAFQKEMIEDRMEKAQEQARQALAKANEFMARHAKAEGVKTTDSGLQYKIMKSASADAAQPAATDTVRVHYHGKLADGTVFDSSVERGKPATLRVDQVIPGWTEALQLMHVGDKWEIVLPPKLAYGERGAGGIIGPNAVLTFEVELLAIEDHQDKQPAAEAAAPSSAISATSKDKEAVN